MMFETNETGITDFSVEWTDKRNGVFRLSTPHIAELLPYLLKRQRSLVAISQGELAKRVGSKSHNSMAAYELGDRLPTLTKLAEILSGLGLDLEIFHHYQTSEEKSRDLILSPEQRLSQRINCFQIFEAGI